MSWLLGGSSSLHDRLIAAALRGLGVSASAVPPAGPRALERGRAAMCRGYPNSVYHLVGATIAELERRGSRAAHGVLTVSGHFSHWASDYRRALDGAGFAQVALESLSLREALTDGSLPLSLGPNALSPIGRAVTVADALCAASAEARSATADPLGVALAVTRALEAVEDSLSAGRLVRPIKPIGPILDALRGALARLPRGRRSVRARVRIIGDPFSAVTDGSGNHGVLERLEARGAEVVPQPLSEWLLWLAWQAHGSPRAARFERTLRRSYRAYAACLGLDALELPDFDDRAGQVGATYPAQLTGGSGWLEVASFLSVERDQSADLVVSLKPFASIPSSAISDAVLLGRSRRRGSIGFLSIETTEDADAQVESRLELALDLAVRRAGRRQGARP